MRRPWHVVSMLLWAPGVALCAEDTTGTMEVRGTGRVDVTPDRAELRILVSVEKGTVAAARQEADGRLKAAIAAVEELKIEGLRVGVGSSIISRSWQPSLDRPPGSRIAPIVDVSTLPVSLLALFNLPYRSA